MGAQVLAEYPAVPGNKPMTVAIINGPAAYVPIVAGVPPTGGQVIKARDVGLVEIESASCSMSENGMYQPLVIFDAQEKHAQQIRLIWVLAATGAEVAVGTKLDVHKFRLTAIGH